MERETRAGREFEESRFERKSIEYTRSDIIGTVAITVCFLPTLQIYKLRIGFR